MHIKKKGGKTPERNNKFCIISGANLHKTLSKGNRRDLPDLQTESCSAVIWPGCLSAHTSAPGYQSRSTSLLKQLPTGTVPGTLSNQEKRSFIIQAHLRLRPEK